MLADQLRESIKPMFDTAGRRTQKSSDKSPEAISWLCIHLLGDPRMVRALVRSAPWTVEEIFNQFSDRDLNNIPVIDLASNIGTELIVATDSPLRWEITGYTGYFKHFQPIGTAVFGDSELVEKLSPFWGPLALVGKFSWRMDPDQLRNYAAAILIYSRDLVRRRRFESRALRNALESLTKACMTISDVNGRDAGVFDDPAFLRFEIATEVISEIMKLLDEAGYEYPFWWREDERSIISDIADAIFEMINYAASEKYPNAAKAVLIGSITFDEESGELVKTYSEGVSAKATEERLSLDPPGHLN